MSSPTRGSHSTPESKLAAVLEAMPARNNGAPRRVFTADEDKQLLKYRPVRTWDQLVEAFGVSKDTLRHRYRELTEGKV